MKEFYPVLKQTKLFRGIAEHEIGSLLHCLGASVRRYRKGEYLLRQGERLTSVALSVSGVFYIQRDDYWGNRMIVKSIAVGETFGEAYLLPESGASPHDIVAVEDSTVLFLDVSRMLTVCSSACPFHTAVLQNLFFTISEKNRMLLGKLGHLSMRTTREKLISYLSEEARRQNSASFSIPFNRQQLADFLSVDRSAMSTELGKMRDEGLLAFEKNRFTLFSGAGSEDVL
ncbi:MAG: Crp/Fnr family transcriptional regulator [Clostridia bacterium]|nr:Crp/Fnr family transcriptional regulator [Clostridia bacterium]